MIVNRVTVKVRAFHTLVVCDIAGCCKVLALPGHSARLGCSKCLQAFEVSNHWPLYGENTNTNWLHTQESWAIFQWLFSTPMEELGSILQSHYIVRYRCWSVCWMNFVKACCLLCSRAITASDVDKGDKLLTLFCCGLQAYFTPQSCTMNMHIHLHLRQCLLDYVPIYGFWCFPYEQYNGKLGDYASNRKSIEVQVARKFLREHFRHLTRIWWISLQKQIKLLNSAWPEHDQFKADQV